MSTTTQRTTKTASHYEAKETAKVISLSQSTPNLCFETARKISTTTTTTTKTTTTKTTTTTTTTVTTAAATTGVTGG